MKNLTISNWYLLLLISGIFHFYAVQNLAYGQTAESSKQQYDVWNGNTSIIQTSNSDIKGTPFYNDEWTSGKVIFRDKTISEELPLKYNSYENLLIFKDGDKMHFYEPAEIQGFILLDDEGNIENRFMNGIYDKDNNIEPTQLLRVIYYGDTKLLAHHKTIFSKNAGRDPFSNVPYSEFKENVDYFIVDEHGDVKETRIRQKNLIRDLNNYENELKKYVRSSRLKVNSEEEAMALLNYYDQLKSKN